MKNLVKWLYLLFIINFKIFIRFFTLWGLVFFALYCCGFLTKYQESIFYILLIVSIGGLYIVYINPKKIIIPYYNIILDNRLLQVLDILGHHLPLILFLILYKKKIKHDNLILLFVVVITYLFFINPFIVYNL